MAGAIVTAFRWLVTRFFTDWHHTLDERQVEEVFLTSAQSLFALAMIANFDMTVREAAILLVTFLAQLSFPQTEVRVSFAIFYVVVVLTMVLFEPSYRRKLLAPPAMVRETVGLSPPSRARAS